MINDYIFIYINLLIYFYYIGIINKYVTNAYSINLII